MNLDFQAGGSPLAARMNPIIYAILLLGLAVIAVLIVLAFFLRKHKEYKERPEYIEAQKKRPTTKKDVTAFAQKYLLNDEEANFLWKLCKKYKITNIFWSVRDFETIEPFFLQYYSDHKNDSPSEINLMFRVKFRLERIFAASVSITSTKVLAKDIRISEIFPDGSKKAFSLYANTKEYLAIKITPEFYESETKPDNLEKVAFTFHSETGMRYAFVSRVIRYEMTNDGPTMLVSHSNDLITKQQRKFKRAVVSEKCKIASVKAETNKKGEKIYSPTEKKFDCILTNISGGGCCISTTLPIKESQFTYVEISLPDGDIGLIGKIVKTRKSATQGLYNIHIEFYNISLEIQNKILAKVYKYN